MGSRFFHACGYNVPEETIVYWKPDLLRIKEGVTYTDNSGQVQPLTMDVLNEVLENVERSPDGYIRSLASAALKNVKGPFSYNGTRRDDPNDWCKHEHRRELRALRTLDHVVGLGQGSGRGLHACEDLTSFEANRYAAKEAYAMSGLKPEDIQFAEVHDCFSMAELIHMEDLGFYKPGQAYKAVEQG